MAFPIPTHLQDTLIPVGNSNSEFEVTGTIRCTCGGEAFEVWENNDRRVVKLICKECGQEHLLFDAGKHGWDGFVCNGEQYIDREQPFKKFVCSECSADSFRITAWISSQGKKDFIDECVSHDDSFTPEDWVNGFEWITVTLTCYGCGVVDKEWLDLETM